MAHILIVAIDITILCNVIKRQLLQTIYRRKSFANDDAP